MPSKKSASMSKLPKASPSSAKKTSRSRSTSRGRSQGDSKKKASPSPSRASKKTTKKSPSRASKSPARKRDPSPSPERKASPAKRDSSPAKKSKSSPTRKPEAESASRGILRKFTLGTSRIDDTPLRVSARLADHHESFTSTTVTNTRSSSSPLKKDAHSYHFGGPIGTTLLTLALPALTLYLSLLVPKPHTLRFFLPPTTLATYLDARCIGYFLIWILGQAILAVLPIGRNHSGRPLSGGRKLQYRCNGFLALVLTLAKFGVAAHYRPTCVLYIYDHVTHFVTASILVSFIFSLVLYFKARKASRSALVSENNTGCWPYDFFMGRELNPRVWRLDLKFFCEMRPGLIGWAVLDMVFLFKSYDTHKQLDPVLLCLTVCHLLYIADALFFEKSILSTYDITTEGFGFMLCFGNLSFVPFIFSLSSRFVLERGAIHHLSYPLLGAIVCLNLFGYFIFRASNSQKDLFRTNPQHPSFSRLATISTTGNKYILAGGWWGLVRHPNYVGDIIMAISWSLLTGFQFALPWFYPVYLISLLVSREFRDEAHCERKYGSAWRTYQQRVKYRLIPYVF